MSYAPPLRHREWAKVEVRKRRGLKSPPYISSRVISRRGEESTVARMSPPPSGGRVGERG